MMHCKIHGMDRRGVIGAKRTRDDPAEDRILRNRLVILPLANSIANDGTIKICAKYGVNRIGARGIGVRP